MGKKYDITGMSCAACSARVESAVRSVAGVKSCSVSLLTNSMTVDGGEEERIISAVRGAGYGIVPHTDDSYEVDKAGKREIRKIIVRLILSVALSLPLMYLSMGHVMWSFPLPQFVSGNEFLIALLQLILALAVMGVNYKFFVKGTLGVIHLAPNMDTLVSLGSLASFGWSVWVFIKIASGGYAGASHGHGALGELYFESAAMILTLITVGKLLEAVAKGKTTSAIKDLVALTPKTVTVLRDGVETVILSKEVTRGDTFIVRPGESIGADGTVLEGGGSVDESSLTGESVPSEKLVGSPVYAATVNKEGYLVCRAEKVGGDTVMSEVIRLVENASTSKAPIAKVADRVALFFVPAVILIAIITTVVWLFVNKSCDFAYNLGYALERGISVLVISCPCALGLATPVAIMSGTGIGAKGGALFKSAESIEALGKVKTVIFDKTGTLTTGVMSVSEVKPYSISNEELISIALSVEEKSEHPIARAIVEFGKEFGAKVLPTSDFVSTSGIGVRATCGGEQILATGFNKVCEIIEPSAEVKADFERMSSEGKTPIFFIGRDKLLGVIAVSDAPRLDAGKTVKALTDMGIRCVMLTGDNKRCANAVAERIGGIEVIPEVMPADKERIVREKMASGGVCMVGDGINDAPALAAATVGIAMGSGTDIAIESADVVISAKNLSVVAGAVRLSRKTLLTIKENLFWAFIYNVIGIPIAAGVFIFAGIKLTPMFGALAMSFSSVTVVLNALRLNARRIFDKPDAKIPKTAEKPDKTNNFTVKEEEKMEKIFNVKGMMCPHCEAHVVKAVSAIPGVESCTASHKEEKVTVILNGEVGDAEIIKVITDEGYTVV